MLVEFDEICGHYIVQDFESQGRNGNQDKAQDIALKTTRGRLTTKTREISGNNNGDRREGFWENKGKKLDECVIQIKIKINNVNN